ncbi:MAG: DNA polymerase I [Armatimonadota bacterium]
MAEKLLLIDGNSLVHRAFHALPHLSTSTGQPTNAVYGLAQMLLALLEEQDPDDVVVAFDAPGKTFRHDMYEQYKADRPPTPDELKAQWPYIHRLISALGLTAVEKEGYEADDLIGTLVKKAREEGIEVTILSGDRDLLQLVQEDVEVLITTRGIKETTKYDPRAFEEEYEIPPDRFVDMKALTGDSSDNIPGIRGIGPKTAASLLTEYPSLEDIYEHLDEISGAVHDRLADSEDDARLSKELARIETDSPIDTAPADFAWEGMDTAALRQLLMELEFSKLLERLPSDPENHSWTGTLEAADEHSIADICAQAAEEGKIYVVPTRRESQVALALAAGTARAVSVLVETDKDVQTGLFDDAATSAVPDAVVEVLEDEDIAISGARLKDLDSIIRQFGVTISGLSFDAEIADYLLTPQRTDHSVCQWAAQCMGWDPPDESAEEIDGLPGWRAYGCVETLACAQLQDRLCREMKEQGTLSVFEEIELPLVPILVDMERAGIGMDTERLDEVGQQLDEMMETLGNRIYELADTEFNIDSPKQVGEVLFDQMELPGGRKTKTGWSTAADVLEDLKDDHEIVACILEYRGYAKLKSTYVDSLAEETDPDTGLIHTTFEQTVAATGRLSSRGPNLQNIPIRTEWGREIRGCFWSGVEGKVLLAGDYSQIELRILADMSGDPTLTEAFEEGRDIHALTAALIFDVEQDDVSYEMRSAGKTVNYAILYGMGSRALASQLDISTAEAKEFIKNYHRRLPKVEAFMQATVEKARETGYVSTALGRRRPMPELLTSNRRARAYAERAAANAPLQGTAADIVKIAMVNLDEVLKAQFPETEMLLQVHDEIVIRTPREGVVEVAETVRDVMENAHELSVPLTVDVAMGDNWRDMEPLLD